MLGAMQLAPSTIDDLADNLVSRLGPGDQLIVPISNGEPVALLDALEARASSLDRVKIHQMHALRDRPYIRGESAGHLDHVSWFLSPVTRPAYEAGHCSFTPANFSEVPMLMMAQEPAFVLAAASPPDANGFFSLGTTGSYTTAMIGRVPMVLEVNDQMPRTFGANRVHVSEIEGWCEASYPLIAVDRVEPSPIDKRIAELVAERIPNGATIQLGIGGVPTAVADLLTGHRDLAIHTELFSDPMVDLIQAGAVTGLHKNRYRGRSVATFALGSQRLYDFVHDNDGVVFLAVDDVNDPRNIGREPNFVSVNGTIEVDLVGQCASETIGTRYFSGSGGQADFARGSPVLRRGGRVHRRPVDGGRGHGQSNRPPPEAGGGRHHREEHRRQRRDRVRRGRPSGANPGRAGQGPDRHRPSRLPGRADQGRARVGAVAPLRLPH